MRERVFIKAVAERDCGIIDDFSHLIRLQLTVSAVWRDKFFGKLVMHLLAPLF
jgi:hypothetical protein